MSRVEPPVITVAREAAQLPDDQGRTVYSPPGTAGVWRLLRVRPELMSENQNHGRVYWLRATQARKVMKTWESGVREQWEAYHARDSA